jgi:hypothetical protein
MFENNFAAMENRNAAERSSVLLQGSSAFQPVHRIAWHSAQTPGLFQKMLMRQPADSVRSSGAK